jgi:hypothetical protein
MAAPYSLQVVEKKGYLHARIGGENTPEVTRRYVLEVIDACRKAKCRALLLEENLEGPRMGLGELMTIVQDLHAEFRAAIHIAAFVDVSPARSDENMRFVEDASVNRGAGVAAFRTVAEAEAWLREQLEG